ncbi:TPA: carbamoyl-phosphate synthase large subunit [Candidatus Gracilibacteria bacterium]|nr:carbamoyl-phosphate synthase large subunit [Candidatus Gracilibacteria bacterium]HIQ57411.1 carbamoyl-phosphate synthase large subunit [Candidatus Gracilibacteria bacterium]
MPNIANVKKVLLLGSGALKIGEAGEFDYSGSQAIEALQEENIEIILVNPNIATNQTSTQDGVTVYFQPVLPEFVERIIEKEKPDAIMLAWGGQTALNCGSELYHAGVLKKHNVKVLGTSVETIDKTEDRKVFNEELTKIGVCFPKSRACETAEEARKALKEIKFPCLVRAAFTLGGGGSGFAYNEEEFEVLIKNAFAYSPQILVEESLKGWKEIEYEVVRDRNDNCITVCNMENFDPLGIHTGESIVIAPSQTLSNEEYQMLRTVAIKTIRHLGVVGECNIQYALDPNSQKYRVIEVNARLSRSSALASKATGYPLAYVAVKLALGYTLDELTNTITGCTSTLFEPSLDYVALKIPRWDLNKFRKVSQIISSEMKSVGEVMALGRTFEEVLQKGLRMLQTGAQGISDHPYTFDDVRSSLANPTPLRVFAIYQALQENLSVEEIADITKIDKWFLEKIERIYKTEQELKNISADSQNEACEEFKSTILKSKKEGFSDNLIGKLLNKPALDIRNMRKNMGIIPVSKKIDTLAGEFPSQTNYLYITYHGTENE